MSATLREIVSLCPFLPLLASFRLLKLVSEGHEQAFEPAFPRLQKQVLDPNLFSVLNSSTAWLQISSKLRPPNFRSPAYWAATFEEFERKRLENFSSPNKLPMSMRMMNEGLGSELNVFYLFELTFVQFLTERLQRKSISSLKN